MNNLAEQICRRIAQVRTDCCGPRGRAEFARKLGISASTYNYYETSRVPPAETLVRIAELAGASLEWLLTGQEPRYRPSVTPRAESTQTAEIQRTVAELLDESPRFASTIQAFLETLKEVSGLPDRGPRLAKRHDTLDPRSLIPIVGYTAASPAHFWSELNRQPPAEPLDQKIEQLLFDRVTTGRMSGRLEGSEERAPEKRPVALVQLSAPDERGVIEFLDAPAIRAHYGDAIAWRIDGDSMSPRFEHGDVVVGSSRVPARAGQPCIARLHGQIGVVCKNFEPHDDVIRLVSINEAFPVQQFSRSELAWAVAVLWSVRIGSGKSPGPAPLKGTREPGSAQGP